MNKQQHDKPFLIVADEFNCLFGKGHYFHMAYDEDVRESIPCNKINLFEPIMNAMNLSTASAEDEEDSAMDAAILAGSGASAAIVVGTTESRAVKREITDSLTACAKCRSEESKNHSIIEVPRFTSIEVDHILANFEATGIGKLRLDRGSTVMNKQEIEYFKSVSGCIGQKLLDVSIM